MVNVTTVGAHGNVVIDDDEKIQKIAVDSLAI